MRTGEEIIDLLRGGQGVFNVVPLAGVVGEVDAAIHRIGSAHMASSASVPADVAPAASAEAAAISGPARLAEGG
jgi:hypothetical protein